MPTAPTCLDPICVQTHNVSMVQFIIIIETMDILKKTLPLLRNRGYAYHQVPSVRERHSGVAVRV